MVKMSVHPRDMPEALGRYGRYFCINNSSFIFHSSRKQTFLTRWLRYVTRSYLTFFTVWKEQNIFFMIKTLLTLKPAFRSSIRNCKKSKGFLRLIPIISLCTDLYCLSSMGICSHVFLWCIRHPTAGHENVMALSCLALQAFWTVHLFPFLISILVFPSLKMSIMSIIYLLDMFTV